MFEEQDPARRRVERRPGAGLRRRRSTSPTRRCTCGRPSPTSASRTRTRSPRSSSTRRSICCAQQRELVNRYWHDAFVQIEDFTNARRRGELVLAVPGQPARGRRQGCSIACVPEEGATAGPTPRCCTPTRRTRTAPTCGWSTRSTPKVQGDLASWFGSVPAVPSRLRGQRAARPPRAAPRTASTTSTRSSSGRRPQSDCFATDRGRVRAVPAVGHELRRRHRRSLSRRHRPSAEVGPDGPHRSPSPAVLGGGDRPRPGAAPAPHLRLLLPAPVAPSSLCCCCPPLLWLVVHLPRVARRAAGAELLRASTSSPGWSTATFTLDTYGDAVRAAPTATSCCGRSAMAAAVTVACALLAFPLAYYMARFATRRTRIRALPRGAAAAVVELPRPRARVEADPRARGRAVLGRSDKRGARRAASTPC